jgi:hypothetical protein
MNSVLSGILGALSERVTRALVGEPDMREKENQEKTEQNEMTWGEFTERLNASTEQLRQNNAILAQMAAPFMEEAAPIAEA